MCLYFNYRVSIHESRCSSFLWTQNYYLQFFFTWIRCILWQDSNPINILIDFSFIPGISIDTHSNKVIIAWNHKFSKQSCHCIISTIAKHANWTNRNRSKTMNELNKNRHCCRICSDRNGTKGEKHFIWVNKITTCMKYEINLINLFKFYKLIWMQAWMVSDCVNERVGMNCVSGFVDHITSHQRGTIAKTGKALTKLNLSGHG